MRLRLSYSTVARGGSRTSGLGEISGDRAKPERNCRGTPPLLSDDQILEMRALHDFAGWSPKRLQLRFAVDADMVKRVLSGITRSRLVATRAHLPEGGAA